MRAKQTSLPKVAVQSAQRVALRAMMLLGFSLIALIWLAQSVFAADKIIKSHGISSFGELKYGADFAHFDYVNPAAPEGGEFSTWGFGTFDSLTPYILKGNAGSLATIFFDSLMTGNADEPDSMYGLVAHTVEYPESREWAIFHMRPEARFANDTPVTAEDVVFTYNTLLEKGRPTFKVTFEHFESVEALDRHTVKFSFNPDGPLRELLMTAAGLPIFSKAYYADRDFAKATLEPPLGSGEYELLSVDAGRNVAYKRRPDYWGKDLPVNVGTMNFDVLKVEYFADYTTAFEAFKGGAYTYREEYMSKLWATSYEFPAVEKGWVKLENLPDGRPAGTQGFWFNLRKEKFSDPRLREAIGMAFNFQWSNESLFYGIYSRTDSFWENSSILQADGMPTAAELTLLEPMRAQLPIAVFDQPAYVPLVSKASNVGDRTALRKAGKLLDKAGWTVGEDGVRINGDGVQLTLDVMNDSASFERIIQPYVENLKRLGVAASSTRVDPAEAQERQKNFDYDMVVQRYAMSSTPGNELKGIFGSDTADIAGSSNLAGLAHPAVDALIRHIADAESRADLTTAVTALDRVLRALHIWVPQWYKPVHNIAYFDVYDRPYTDTPPPYAMGEMSIWWYNADKAQALKDVGAF